MVSPSLVTVHYSSNLISALLFMVCTESFLYKPIL